MEIIFKVAVFEEMTERAVHRVAAEMRCRHVPVFQALPCNLDSSPCFDESISAPW